MPELDFQGKNPWGQLAAKLSGLVASNKYFSEKSEKLVASEKHLVALATLVVTMSSSECWLILEAILNRALINGTLMGLNHSILSYFGHV